MTETPDTPATDTLGIEGDAPALDSTEGMPGTETTETTEGHVTTTVSVPVTAISSDPSPLRTFSVVGRDVSAVRQALHDFVDSLEAVRVFPDRVNVIGAGFDFDIADTKLASALLAPVPSLVAEAVPFAAPVDTKKSSARARG